MGAFQRLKEVMKTYSLFGCLNQSCTIIYSMLTSYSYLAHGLDEAFYLFDVDVILHS